MGAACVGSRVFGQNAEEFRSFFGPGARPAAAPADADRLKTLWRKLQYGERQDRLAARLEIIGLVADPARDLRAELATDNHFDSRNAAMIVARSGDRGALPILRDIVQGKERGSLRHAALALGRLGSADDVDLLLAAPAAARRDDARRAILYAIGRIGLPKDAEKLTQLWDEETAQEQRAALMLALGRIGGAEAAKAIAKGLASPKEFIRRAAAAALADLRDPRELPALKARLADSDDTVVRYAVFGLALIVHPDVPKIIDSKRLLAHKRDDIRAAAVTALGFQDPNAAIPVLAAFAKTGERAVVGRRALAFAWARLGGAEAPKHLSQLLEDADGSVVRAAAAALAAGRQGSPIGAALALVDKRQDEDVRALGLDLLARGAPEKAREWGKKVLAANDDKKDFLEKVADMMRLLDRPGASRALLDARLQTAIDDLGGSAEWNILQALHEQFLVIEKIDRPLTERGSGVAPGAPGGDPSRPRQPAKWDSEDEDLRLWYDKFHYFDRRARRDVE